MQTGGVARCTPFNGAPCGAQVMEHSPYVPWLHCWLQVAQGPALHGMDCVLQPHATFAPSLPSADAAWLVPSQNEFATYCLEFGSITPRETWYLAHLASRVFVPSVPHTVALQAPKSPSSQRYVVHGGSGWHGVCVDWHGTGHCPFGTTRPLTLHWQEVRVTPASPQVPVQGVGLAHVHVAAEGHGGIAHSCEVGPQVMPQAVPAAGRSLPSWSFMTSYWKQAFCVVVTPPEPHDTLHWDVPTDLHWKVWHGGTGGHGVCDVPQPFPPQKQQSTCGPVAAPPSSL